MSYQSAPGTGVHVQVGMASPLAGSGFGTGAASVFLNVPAADHVRPSRFSSSARTRQYRTVSAGYVVLLV